MSSPTSALEPLVRKLEIHSRLSPQERESLLALRFDRRPLRSHAALFRGAGAATHYCVMLDGYAARYKLLPDGSRQILNLLMRGDLVGIQRCLFQRADHDVEMLTAGTVAIIAASDLAAVLTAHPNLAQALWSETLFECAIQREWTVNVGRRNATARVAHLLCELGVRHDQQGISPRAHFDLRLTQGHIADCAGLTPVHVNRVFRTLAEDQLVGRHGGRVTIEDWAGLARLGGFDGRYLQPQPEEPSSFPLQTAGRA